MSKTDTTPMAIFPHGQAGGMGAFAVFEDSQGNRVGVHAMR